MGSEYISLFDNKDSRGFSLTVEDLSITTVQQEVKDMLDLAEPSIFRISDKIELIPMPGYSLRELVLRCIVRKAYESMLAILDLVRLRHSLPAMSLLRSMCEELIFAKFIKLLPYSDVETFLSEKSILELFQGNNAQIEYFLYVSKKIIDNELLEKQKKLRKNLIEVPRQRLKELGGETTAVR